MRVAAFCVMCDCKKDMGDCYMSLENRNSRLKLVDRLKCLLGSKCGLFNQRRTLFFGIIMLFFICLVCLMLFLALYTSSIMDQTEESRISTMETCLDFAVESTDYLFETSVGQSLERVYDTYSIMAISFTSSSFHISGSALARVKADLNLLTTTSPLISNSFLYVPNSDLVVTSSYASSSLSDSVYAEIIKNYENGLADIASLNICKDSVSIFSYGNDYIIARDLYVLSDQKQSTLYLVLDRDEIYDHIQTSISNNNNIRIYIYDLRGNQMVTSHPEDRNDQFDPSKVTVNGNFTSAEDGLQILSRSSDITPFNYYLTVEEFVVRPTFFSMLPTVLPFTILFFLMFCLIIVFATIYFYKPLRNTISKLGKFDIQMPENSEPRNEFDYLNRAIASIVDRQEYMQSMLRIVSQDVQTRLFSDLLSGTAVGYDDIVSTLKNLNSPFKLNAVYVAGAIKYLGSMSLSESEHETNEIIGCISEVSGKFAEQNALSVQILQVEPGLFAIILQFHDVDTSIVSGKHTILKLKNLISETLELKQYECMFEFGHLYHSILDVSFSFKEALNAIVVSEMLQEGVAAQEERDSRDASMNTIFDHRAAQIVEACRNNNRQNLVQIVDHVICDIEDATTDISMLVQISKNLISTCVNHTVSCEYINLSLIPDVYSEFCERATDCENAEQIIACVKAAVFKLTDVLAVLMAKQQNPHIVAAREYIQKNYADISLSLDSIASGVRISSSYLSKLFSDSIGITPFEYLTRYRVDASMQILLDSELAVTEIAATCGFSSSRNYIRAFKKFYQETPGEYRKLHRKKDRPNKEERP